MLLGAVRVPLNFQLKALPWGRVVLAVEAGGQAGPRLDSGLDHRPKGYVQADRAESWPGAPGTLVIPALLLLAGPESQAAAPLPAHPFGFLASPLSLSTPPSSPISDAGLILGPQLMGARERSGRQHRHPSHQQRRGGGAGRSARQNYSPGLPPWAFSTAGCRAPGLHEAYTELGAVDEAPSPLCAADKLGAQRPGIFLCTEAGYLR